MLLQATCSSSVADVSHEVARLSGMRIPPQAWARLEAFVRERSAHLHLDSPQAYAHLLAQGGAQAVDEFGLIGTQFSTPETYFFRDHGQIALLRETLLPPLLAQRDAPVRIWSCGCSSGEELYTLAILIDQMVAPAQRDRVVLVGTDLSEKLLEKARAGRYSDWSFRGCDPLLRQAYFHEGSAGVWTLDASIRERVRLQACNLIQDELPAPLHDLQQFDLILCRNVFIYFSPETVRDCLRKLARCLNDTGAVLTGHNEVLNLENTGLSLEMHPQSALLRRFTPAQAQAQARARAEAAQPLGHVVPVVPLTTAIPAKPLLAPSAAARPGAATPSASVAAAPAPGPSVEAELTRAWRLADLGDPASAAQVCRDLLQRDPTQPRAHYLQAVLAIESGELAAALAALKRALYLDPSNVAVHLQLAEVQRRAAGPQAGRHNLDAALRLLGRMPPDAEVPWLEGHRVAQVLTYVQGLARVEDAL